MRRRRELLFVLGVCVLAFALRALYVRGFRASPTFDAPALDVLYHVEWARALAAGVEYHDGPFFRAPLYPWLLSLAFRVLGEDLVAVRLIQALLGSLTALLVYLVGRRAFDSRTGLLAALFAATSWVLIYFDAELLIPTLIVPLDLAALLFALGAGEGSHARRDSVLSGVCFGLSAIARPNVLLVAPFVACWIAWRARTAGRRSAAPLALFAAAVLAPILPVTAVNVASEGDLVLISSQAGVNLWIGNNPESDGSTAVVPGTRRGWWEGYHDSIALAEAEAGRELAASGVSRHYARKAAGFIADEPAEAARLLWKKLVLFCTSWEVANNQEARFIARRYAPWTRFLPVHYAWLLPLGLLGIAFAWRDRARVFPLVAFLFVYSATVVAFFVTSRYRVPVLPVLMVFGAHAAARVWDLARERRWGIVACTVGAVALGALGVSRDPYGLAATEEANGYYGLGLAEAEHGDDPAALEHFRRAADLNPGEATTHRAVAHVLLRMRRSVEAEGALSRALLSDPDDPVALDMLASLSITLGRLEEAERAAERSRRAAPASATPYYDLGRVRRSAGRVEAAAQLFEEALTRDPKHFRAAYELGVASAKLGLLTETIAAFEQAVAHFDGTEGELLPLAFENLVDLLLRAGERERAVRHAEAYAAARPGDARARALLERTRH